MLDPIDESPDNAAADALATLYAALAGSSPLSVRAYHDDDAMLVLLRFDARAALGAGEEEEPPIEIALMAMPDLVADAVRRRTGHALEPGSLSVSAPRGLALFTFTLVAESAPAVPLDTLAGGLRLAS